MMSYAISIFLGTLIVEDVALASSLVLVAEHKMPAGVAFASCFFGN